MTKLFIEIDDLINFNDNSLKVAALSILFNPIFWNTVARREYHTKFLTKLASGNSHLACYGLGITIFSLGIIRDFLFERAIREQPTLPLFSSPLFQIISYCLFIVGNILVISSMWALGFVGTYLGDYFGILMDKVVTDFPFNITNAPMYYGSTMSFLGAAIYYQKLAGVLLTLEIFIVYLIALRFEDPFTAKIYANRQKKKTASHKNI